MPKYSKIERYYEFSETLWLKNVNWDMDNFVHFRRFWPQIRHFSMNQAIYRSHKFNNRNQIMLGSLEILILSVCSFYVDILFGHNFCMQTSGSTIIYRLWMGNPGYDAYLTISIFCVLVLMRKWAWPLHWCQGLETEQKFGRLSGPFGSTVISQYSFRNLQACPPPSNPWLCLLRSKLV